MTPRIHRRDKVWDLEEEDPEDRAADLWDAVKE